MPSRASFHYLFKIIYYLNLWAISYAVIYTDNKIGCPTFSGAIVGGGVGAIGGIVGSIVGIPGAIVGGILGGAIGGNVGGKIAGEETLKEPNKFLKRFIAYSFLAPAIFLGMYYVDRLNNPDLYNGIDNISMAVMKR